METKPWHRHYDYNVPTSIRYPRIPAQDFLNLAAKSYPQKPALSIYGSEITFWELRTLVMRTANALGGLGISRGDRVGLLLPNCPQYTISYYATLSLGAIVVNLNPLYTPYELQLMVNTTGLKALIAVDVTLPSVRTLCETVQVPTVVVTAVTDFIKGFPVSSSKSLDLEEGWHHFSELLVKTSSVKVPRVNITPDDPAMILFTGGTTGIPKGTVLTHGNVVAAVMACSLWGNPTISLIPPERRTVLALLPYFHVYGNIVVMNWAMFSVATQIQMPRFDMDELIDLLSKTEELTFFPTVPTLITGLMNHPRVEELHLERKIGLLNSGAAPMAAELIEQINEMGIPFSEGYGMSESTALGVSNPILGLSKVGSIGVPIPDNDVRIVDIEDGVTEVPPGQPGEIIMKGPVIMREYWNNPEETAQQLRDGWLYTGDIATRDDDGYMYIVDRKKDMIIAGGFNIYPREIDEVLFLHPKVAEAVAVGIRDPYRGETVKAYIVPKQGEAPGEDEIINFCREKLAPYKVPKMVEFRESLPKSAVGKILRKILREEEEAKEK